MAAPLCESCGGQLTPGVDRCPSCGATRSASPGRRTVVVVALIVAGLALLVTTVAVVALVAGDGGGGSGGEVFASAPAERTTTSVAPTTAASTTSTTAPPTTAASVPPAVTGNPYEVIADWAVAQGLSYVGLCDQLDPTLDLGPDPWCAQIVEDRGTEMVVRVADFPGGDFGVWLLLRALPSGWSVVEVAEDVGAGSPF